MDIFTVGSNMERDILVEQIGVEAKRLVVTGYARYDILHNTCSAPPIHIAYMPTHRDWLHEGAHAFKESDFHHQLVRFLSSPTLHNLLHHANAHLKVRLHPANMAFTQMISDNHPRITFVRNQDATPLELIRESHILITDYSGVAFDFIYLNKPVIFYRFDAQRYISERGSYIDLEDTRFGDIYTEPEPLIQGLHHIIDNGCTLDTTRHTWRQCVMPHLDQGNCHRIYQAINEKWPRHHRN